MFILDMHTLKEGDVFLTSQKGLVSKAVQGFTNSKYSHAILYVGHGSYIHSDSQGVHSANIQRLIFEKPANVKVLRPNNPKLAKDASKYARSQIGKEYSVKEAIRAKSGVRNKSENKQFCSRLVAQAFEYAGEEIVKDTAYCTPEDINRSPAFSEIENAVRVASLAEMEFANSFNPIQRQAEITNLILSESRRITGSNIQSLEELTMHVIENPSFSDEIVDIYNKSGYLTMWQHELRQNPWRYDGALFMSLPIDLEEKRNLAASEAESAESMLELYGSNYMVYKNLSMRGMSSYIKMNIELYMQLMMQMKNRFEAAKYVLNHT